MKSCFQGDHCIDSSDASSKPLIVYLPFLPMTSVAIPRHRSRLSHVNVFLRHYGGKLKAAVKQEAGEMIDWKR